MKLTVRTVVPFVMLGLAALAACGGGGGSTGSNIVYCAPPQGQAILTYPAPGSTGIPDNVFGVIFASTNGLPSSFRAELLPPTSSTYFLFQTVTAAPSPVPTPYATPPYASPIYQESAFTTSLASPLPSSSVMQVYLADSASTCTPQLMGTFNSQ